MSDPQQYFFELPANAAPAPFGAPERVYPDIHWYNQNRASNRIFHAVEGVEAVVIHATAGGSSEGALSWWKSPQGGKASAHWIVPSEEEAAHGQFAWAVVYESLAAWHVRNAASHPQLGGREKINHWSLGIEIVNRQIPGDSYSDWQMETTALLVRYCWAKYPNLKFVFSHAFVDPARRSDPGANFDWGRFQTLVLSPNNDPDTDVLVTDMPSRVENAEVNPPSGAPCCM